MARKRRIVCYAVNGAGLGHVTRLLAVARWMRRYAAYLEGRPAEILFLTSTEACGLLAEAGFPAFKIPSKTVVRDGGLDPGEYRRLARQFIWHTLGVFAPDLLVVDTFPSGSFDELFQLLDGPMKKAFLFRRVRSDFARRPIFAAAARLYDVVVRPHAAPAPGEAAELELPMRYAGEVLQLERAEARSREEVRVELGLAPHERLLYLSAGGGGDPESVATLQALVTALREQPDLHLLVGAGPLYRGPRLSGPRLSFRQDSGLARSFAACDGAISAAGYNSFHELLYFRVPCAFFAQEKVADDQAERVAAGQRAGACLALDDPADPAEVRRCVAELLQPARAAELRAGAAAFLPDNGAARCARLLLEPLYGAAGLAQAEAALSPALVLALEAGRSLAESLPLYSDLLPRILPPQDLAQQLEGLAPGLLERVAAELSPEARSELSAALARAPERAGLAAVQGALLRLLAAASARGLDAARLLPLVDAALRKHPLTQEAQPAWFPWLSAVLTGLEQLLGPGEDAALAEERLQLYRVFPRVTDCPAEQGFQLFEAWERSRRARGLPLQTAIHELQALKLRCRQVRVADLRGLAAPRAAL